MIETLLIDIGEVLVGLNVTAALREIDAHTPLQPEEIRMRLRGHPIIPEYESGRLTTEEFFHGLCALIQLDMSQERFSAAWGTVFDFEKGGPEKYLSPTLFARLKTRYRVVALSNTNELHFSHLKDRLPLVHEFDDYVLSFEAGSVKPELAIFRTAISKTGGDPRKLFFVDDLQSNIEAAQAVGIDGLVFENEPQLERELHGRGLLRLSRGL